MGTGQNSLVGVGVALSLLALWRENVTCGPNLAEAKLNCLKQ